MNLLYYNIYNNRAFVDKQIVVWLLSGSVWLYKTVSTCHAVESMNDASERQITHKIEIY